MIILGVDPGSRAMGWGVIRADGRDLRHLAHGVIRPGDGPLPERLKILHDALGEAIDAHGPEVAAVEDLFQHRNVRSAIVLAQARAAAILSAAGRGLPVASYTPAEIKKAVTGGGRADKGQVAEMVRILLGLAKRPPSDAADALGVAICHGMRRDVAALRVSR